MTQRVLHKNKINHGFGSKVFDTFNVLFFLLLAICMVFPFWNVLVISLASMSEFLTTPVMLFPKAPTIETYQYVFGTPLIPRAYGVTATVALSGTVLSVLVVSMLAYGMSKKRLHGQRFFMLYLLVTMFFSGGLIPAYFNIRNVLKIDNTLFALILPGTVSIFNFIIMRAFFQQLPASLEESAKIDGASDLTILFRIIYPLSIPTLATIALFVVVSHWNAWFAADLYIRDAKMFPLQLVIRNYILKANKPPEMQLQAGIRDAAGALITLSEEGLKMTCVAVTIVPLLLVYPFVQKYFEKGVMLGSVKG